MALQVKNLFHLKDPNLTGKLISAYGVIIHIHNDHFILQDYTTFEEQTNLNTIECKIDDISHLKIGSYVKVTGILHSEDIFTYFIQSSEIQFVTKEETDNALNEIKLGFFDYDYLHNFEKDSAQAMHDFLQEHAYLSGFKLAITHSLNQASSKLRCYMHGKNGKNPDLNSDCPFFINITKFKAGELDKWHVTNVLNVHNHKLNPDFFAHKLLTKEQKEYVNLLHSQFIPPNKIAVLLLKKYNIKLSREQISYVSAVEYDKIAGKKTAETEDLEKYMQLINGKSYTFPPENDKSAVKIRQGIATFTKNELDSLKNFGDFISIDPTYAALSTHWIIIPITLIGLDRELKSGGLIFTSNSKSETFQWILDLFVNILPTKETLKTIISDEDSGLDGAFTLTKNQDCLEEFKEKVLKLNRIICSWHKTKNFIKQLTSLKLEKKEYQRFLSLFKIMLKCRDEKVHEECYSELCKNPLLKEYINKCVDPIMNNISKCKFTGFNGGYQSSSISEASNSRLKKLLPTKQLTLKEVREILITAEELTQTSKRFIKGRKLHKMRSPQVLEIMKIFQVSQVISEAICGSINKANRLQIIFDDEKGEALVSDVIKDGEISFVEKFVVSDEGCTCKKQNQVGLPCSHFIQFLLKKRINIYQAIKVNERWVDNFTKVPILPSFSQIKKSNKILQTPPCDERERYILLRAKCMSLITKAAQTQSSYEMVDKMLSDIEMKIDKNEPVIIDDTAARPGRPKKQINLANENNNKK